MRINLSPVGKRLRTGPDPTKEELLMNLYKKLLSYKDDQGVWKFELMNRESTPSTEDKQPVILLPRRSKYVELEMIKAYKKGHVEIKAMVIKFRTPGFWMVQEGKSEKRIKQGCLIYRCLDHYLIMQQMGSREEPKTNPSVWQTVDIDLMGLFLRKSNVNKH